jgi:hypothetical protein
VSTLSQAGLEAAVLQSLFDIVQAGGGRVSAEQVAGRMNNEYSEGRVKMALQALERDKLARAQHNTMTGSKYEISETGFKNIEAAKVAEGANSAKPFESIPGSDRVVGLDHNSRSFVEVVSGAKDLQAQLLSANDVGDLSPRQVQVAAHEIEQIVETLQQDYVRPFALWSRSSSVLGWIGKEAAAALVGAAALALMALIATLLGFTI